MSQIETIGVLVLSVVALASFVGVVLKITAPINKLNLSIIKLTTMLETLLCNDKLQDKTLTDHEHAINHMDTTLALHEQRISNLEQEAHNGYTTHS